MSTGNRLIAFALVAAAVTCLGARDDSGRSDFFYNGSTDEDAARVLVKSLSRLDGVSDVGVLGDELVHFALEKGVDIRFSALCYMTGELDRIDFQISIPLKEGVSSNDKELQRFLNTLNARYAAKFFTLDDPKSPLFVSRPIYFQNHLRGELISAVVRSQASLLAEVAKEHAEECRRFLQ